MDLSKSEQMVLYGRAEFEEAISERSAKNGNVIDKIISRE